MVGAKKYKCKVLAVNWLKPKVMHIIFKPNKAFHFEPGQFLSAYIPDPQAAGRFLRRAYSFASAPDFARKHGYELCVKYVEDGAGSQFLEKLKPGDIFEATAPYGDFVYHPPAEGRSICFICTGTGIAPFRGIVLSQQFHDRPPPSVFCLFGVRSEEDMIFQGTFESAGVETIYCLSQPKGNWKNMKDKKGEWTAIRGRVTDYLASLPNTWNWHTTDFYICGNSDMISDVRKILVGGHGVAESSIYQEVFFHKKDRDAA